MSPGRAGTARPSLSGIQHQGGTMKAPRLLLLATLGVVAYVGTSIAAIDYRGVKIDLEANDSRGQLLYRKNCRTLCHDGEHGNGKSRSPMDLLMADWEKIAANVAKIPCIDKWPAGLTEEDLSDIFSYLHAGAADSPTPVS